MLLSRLLANFTRGESDTLRKAMGKKLIDKMNHLKGKFLEGGQKNGHKPEVLEKIWKDWEKFASYAFNKSHATCYSWVAFQTAYLKANYPSEYMAAVLSRNLNDLSKLTVFMDECRSMGISVLGPDVNESFASFGVNSKGDIRFGLSAIKGVGNNVVAAIVEARGNQPFTDIYDFVERVTPGAVNRRTFENLACAGAFDCFEGIKREDFFVENNRGENFCELLLRYGARYKQNSNDLMGSLFGDDFDTDLQAEARPPVKPGQIWPDIVRLSKERDLVGMYLSAHPLDPYYMELHYGCRTNLAGLKDISPEEGLEVTFGGMVAAFETRLTKKGTEFGILKLEDESGSTELRLFGRTFIDYARFCRPMAAVLVTGKWQKRFRDSELSFEIINIRQLDEIKGRLIRGITISLTPEQCKPETLELLKEHINSETTNRGSLKLRIFDPEINRYVTLSSARHIPVNRKLVRMLDSMDIRFSVDAEKVQNLAY